MKATRTNLTINIQFDTVMDVERVLNRILNEIEASEYYGRHVEDRLSYTYAMEKWSEKLNTDGTITRTYQSRINDASI